MQKAATSNDGSSASDKLSKMTVVPRFDFACYGMDGSHRLLSFVVPGVGGLGLEPDLELYLQANAGYFDSPQLSIAT